MQRAAEDLHEIRKTSGETRARAGDGAQNRKPNQPPAQRYETPIDLRGRKIQLRHERLRGGAVIVYDSGRRVGKARLLDAVANGMARRKEQ